ncbi:MlaA family lipoprotein [Undibacterium sp. Di24W]|uniref:MlaA family lipoprotein n=1 Tax=Undibacterium sp. Di24W TaxID=3413033 RepID=UPI003BEFF380
MSLRFLNISILRSFGVRLLILCALGLTMTACSTVSKVKTKAVATLEKVSETTNIGNNPDDPLEGLNRSVFNFNESLDANLLKPTAQVYQSVTPSIVQTAVGNFFSNAGDVWTAVNNVLQGNLVDGVNDFMRFAINTTMGIGGLIDVASAGGMPKHRADFGQTLGVWGVPSGPFVVLPVLGASTLRDALATPIDFKGDILFSQTSGTAKIATSALKVIDKRASALDAVSLIEEAALDKYVFIRGAYLQRRESQINAGKQQEQE